MVSTNDMRPGQSILVDNILYQILEYQHVKPGKGKAFVKTKLKNLTNGGQLEKTFRADAVSYTHLTLPPKRIV